MTPAEHIHDLCLRYRVSKAFGERMLPLAERATEVRPELRERLHAFLERSFSAQAEAERREAEQDTAKPFHPASPEEERLVRTVAGALHAWTPPRWLEVWAQRCQAGPGSAASS